MVLGFQVFGTPYTFPKKTQGMWQKLQAIYFKIQGTYFKIYGLYFLASQLSDKQQLTKPLKFALYG